MPPFGGNGLGFNKHGNTLFVANTGNDTIVKIPVSAGVPGTPAVFVNSINGADGLVLNSHDNVWVAANQADEIVVVDPSGKAIAKLGDFDGLDKSGVPRGLLFPASHGFSKDGNWLYVTNLTLDLRLFGLVEAVKLAMGLGGQALHHLAYRDAHLPPSRVTRAVIATTYAVIRQLNFAHHRRPCPPAPFAIV